MQIQVTTREAATAHGTSLRTAQRWAAKGKLSAVKTGGRWVITLPAPDLDGIKPTAIDKARELIEQGGIFSTNRPGIYTAISSDGSTTYLTHAAMCTCPGGQRGRVCYHRAAAAILTATRHAA
jgi:excisionase family DNA binding protein